VIKKFADSWPGEEKLADRGGVGVWGVGLSLSPIGLLKVFGLILQNTKREERRAARVDAWGQGKNYCLNIRVGSSQVVMEDTSEFRKGTPREGRL